MYKILLLTCLLLTSLPAVAATSNTDKVIVYNTVINNDETKASMKQYTKPWGQLKLDKATRSKIMGYNQQLDKRGPYPMKVHALRIVNDQVQAVMFAGAESTYWMFDLIGPDPQRCYVTLGGNGFMGGCPETL
jgi:hypothetical protein